jgi:la-related protein 1
MAASKMPPHVNPGHLPYDYQMPPFPAYPFQGPMVDAHTLNILMLQVEYYLSVDNLCKDFFIRKRMDSKGFVPLTVIANFNRMRDLAPDVDAIRLACEYSEKIEYVVGNDNIERLRLREKWDRFVLSMDEREEDARNDGPTQWFSRSRYTRPAYGGPMMAPGYPAASPTMFPPNFPPEEQMYQPPYMNGAHYDPNMNGDVNGHRYGMDSQLSAAVPEFSPSGPAPFSLDSANTFSDQQVDGLMMVVNYDKKDAPTPQNDADPAAQLTNGTHSQANGIAPSSQDAAR